MLHKNSTTACPRSLIWQCNCIVDCKVPKYHSRVKTMNHQAHKKPLNQLLARSTKPEDTEQ
ncbi:hypothetical protein T4A_3818 [Trichinella pseudospiralis]|uniref:Uncharacterized protein n=1 Tax=Trichinella pseudospiralis TaxID=6337 RepID=A0A0V1EI23_TRIPS|nr:hypothetical protein T4A_3818 [Trichinella pseudospiralis]